jgi:4-amino-4-deoxy-L-arabinose transferase-like glycosyltransferase
MMPFEWVWDTCLAALLGAAIWGATLKLAESGRLRDWCGYGLLWGFALMTNPSLVSLLPFLLGWAAYRAQPGAKRRVTRVALAAGIAILCCVPWTVRNYLIFGRFVPLRSNFPLELYIGNNNNYATPQYVWPPKITKEREILRYFRLGETTFMEEEKRKAIEFIRAHPKIFMELNVERFVEFWTGLPEPVKAFETTDSLLIRALLVCNTMVAVGGLLGIAVLIRRRSPWMFPTAAYPVIFPLVYYVTHPNLRYRHPIEPIVLLLAVAGARGVYELCAEIRGKEPLAAFKGPADAKEIWTWYAAIPVPPTKDKKRRQEK